MSARVLPTNKVAKLSPHRRTAPIPTGSAFDALTVALIMERHRRGELDPPIVEALLAGVGLVVELP